MCIMYTRGVIISISLLAPRIIAASTRGAFNILKHLPERRSEMECALGASRLSFFTRSKAMHRHGN